MERWLAAFPAKNKRYQAINSRLCSKAVAALRDISAVVHHLSSSSTLVWMESIPTYRQTRNNNAIDFLMRDKCRYSSLPRTTATLFARHPPALRLLLFGTASSCTSLTACQLEMRTSSIRNTSKTRASTRFAMTLCSILLHDWIVVACEPCPELQLNGCIPRSQV